MMRTCVSSCSLCLHVWPNCSVSHFKGDGGSSTAPLMRSGRGATDESEREMKRALYQSATCQRQRGRVETEGEINMAN